MTHTDIIELQARLIIESVDDAIAFYQAVYGAELIERFVGPDGLVVHASMRIGQSIMSIAQQAPAWKLFAPLSIGGSPVLLHLSLPDPDGAAVLLVERGGEVLIPIEDRFYGRREGRVRDPFGHLWVLSGPIGKIASEEIQRRLDVFLIVYNIGPPRLRRQLPEHAG